MSELIKIDDFTSFANIRSIKPSDIVKEVIATVRGLDEKTQIEPFIRASIYDVNETPHGPAELVDILTHRVTIRNSPGLAAFLLKGKSFPTVRPQHVSHQIYRMRKIAGLKFVVLACTGNILDSVKDEFISTAKDIGCTYSLLDAVDLARLFVAEGFICPRDGKLMAQRRCDCGYSPRRSELNVLQQAALRELADAHRIGEKSGLIVLPTGSGKTRIAVKDSQHTKAGNILYVAHTHEILDIAEDEFASGYGRDVVIRIESPKQILSPSPVKLTTIQFISNHLEKISASPIDYLIIDEFHHAAAKSYKRLINTVTTKFLLGLTATPFRGDRQDVAELCNGLTLYNAELRTGIDSGILSPYHYIGCFDDVDYSKIRHNGQRYDVRDLERFLVVEGRDQAIIERWREHLSGKSTIGFCCTKRHAERCCKSFNDAGIMSALFTSDTSKEERAAIKADFKRGEIKVVFTVDVLNEGVDFPFVEGLLFLRPTESKRIFYQQLGRGLRRFTGKTEAVVLDFIGNFKNAYRIVEFVGLLPEENEIPTSPLGFSKNVKEILNLPLGCRVTFDERVIDIFCSQYERGQHITKYNIGRILIYNYRRLCERIGRLATRADVDRNLLLHSEFYVMLFRSWKGFMDMIFKDPEFAMKFSKR